AESTERRGGWKDVRDEAANRPDRSEEAKIFAYMLSCRLTHLPLSQHPLDLGKIRAASDRSIGAEVWPLPLRRAQATRGAAAAGAAGASAALPAGPLWRRSKSSRNCSCGIAGEISAPWPKSQPIAISACNSTWLSIPSATAALPNRCARSMMVWQIAALAASSAQLRTKSWLILSSEKRSERRLEKEEKPAPKLSIASLIPLICRCVAISAARPASRTI